MTAEDGYSSNASVASFKSVPPVSFPWWALNPLQVLFGSSKKSAVHYRAAILALYFFSKIKPFPRSPYSQENQFVYASLASVNELTQLNLSLWSLSRLRHNIPSCVIGLDQSLSMESAKSYFSGSCYNLSFVCLEEVLNWHKSRGNKYIAEFAKTHIFGFKLALNVMLATSFNVLYADSDVLWFHSISKALDISRLSQFIYASIDSNEAPYDIELMSTFGRLLGFDYLSAPEGCAGVTLFLESAELEVLVESMSEIIISLGIINRLSEQTVIAALAKKMSSFLPESLVCMDQTLTWFLKSTSSRSSIGRHYAGPWRSQFWIDAFYLYVGDMFGGRR